MLATDYAEWTGGQGVRAAGSSVRYALTPDFGVAIGVFRPRQPTDGLPIPAVVSPALADAAGRDGLLPVTVEGEPLLLRVEGVASRFPTVQFPSPCAIGIRSTSPFVRVSVNGVFG